MIKSLRRHLIPNRAAVLSAVLMMLPHVERAVGQPAGTNTSAGKPNLAFVAMPSASHVSGDTSLSALNDGVEPRTSRDNRRGSYGNWNRTGTQWVQYDWSMPISTASIDVYWWRDGQGIGLPKGCRLKYWDGTAFVPVTNSSGLARSAGPDDAADAGGNRGSLGASIVWLKDQEP